ncbi:hypothetical protein NQZ68_006069 [Dissostichus eleginoides]|nr:hypothetical protein NQZ68_006069 [Dissostichus eleginoides]
MGTPNRGLALTICCRYPETLPSINNNMQMPKYRGLMSLRRPSVEVGSCQQMAQAAVQTDSFVPLNKVVAIKRRTADTRTPLV